jgi:pSer/pThr/pTyr-binding forkhead associated (FHA) protein
MPTQLLSLADGPNILLDKPILLFGRHEECDIQLNSKKVSRRHCIVAQIGDYWVVRDLGSTNGVKINGQRVNEGKLHPGDELQIGNFKYQVCGELHDRGPENRPVNVPPAAATERDAPSPLPEAAARRRPDTTDEDSQAE